MILTGAVIAAFLATFALAKSLVGRRPSWLKGKSLQPTNLLKIPHFGQLTPAQLRRVEKIIREVRIPAGVAVMPERDEGEGLYLVVSGKINILQRSALEQTFVQSIGVGEFVGERAILSGVKRATSAQTASASVLIHVYAADFFEFMSISSEINDGVWAASDKHTLELLMRDHEKLRILSLAERRLWINAREAEFRGDGETVKAARDGFFGLISGTAQIGGKTLEAPALVPCVAGEDIRVTRRGRLVFLTPPKKAA